jgi:hypothetical protein
MQTEEKTMKTLRLISVLVVGFCVAAHGGIYYNPVNATIPDGTTAGWSGTTTVSGELPSITGVTVNLNISGGYNGDLYAYLSYGNVLLPLLNRVGVQTGDAYGYGNTGLNITLSSLGAYDVHWYQQHSPSYDSGTGQLLGTWQPDGRAIDPVIGTGRSAPSAFDANGTVSFANFNGMNPNGTWTLFVSDLSFGAQSQLVDWSLEITAVPEPVNVALGVFAAVFLLVGLGRTIRLSRRPSKAA